MSVCVVPVALPFSATVTPDNGLPWAVRILPDSEWVPLTEYVPVKFCEYIFLSDNATALVAGVKE